MARTMPKGTENDIGGHLEPGEVLVAACPGTNIVSAGAEVAAAFLGNAAANTFESGTGAPRYGLAGLVPPGEVLLAVTDRRMLVYRADPNYRPMFAVVAFAPAHLGYAQYSNTVIGNKRLEVRFADGSTSKVGLPQSTWEPAQCAKATAKAIITLRSGTGT